MRPATVIMFAIAFACAGIAAFLMRGLLNAGGNSAAVTVAPAPVLNRQIVVAAREIKPGDKLSMDALKEVSWPVDSLPKGAFFSKDALIKAGEERLAVIGISENEPVLPSKLSGSSDALSGRLTGGMSGVTIRVNDTSSVGGFAQPDDRVDVLMTQTERTGEGVLPVRAYTATLIRNVRVLAVDQQTQRKAQAQAQPPKTVTLEVTAEDAKKLTLAGAIGQLSLTLNRGGSSDGKDLGPVEINDLIQHTMPPATITPAVDIDPLVTITKPGERKDYRVPEEGRR